GVYALLERIRIGKAVFQFAYRVEKSHFGTFHPPGQCRRGTQIVAQQLGTLAELLGVIEDELVGRFVGDHRVGQPCWQYADEQQAAESRSSPALQRAEGLQQV